MKLFCSAIFMALLLGMISCNNSNSNKSTEESQSTDGAKEQAVVVADSTTKSATEKELPYDSRLIRSWVTRDNNSKLVESRVGVKLWDDGVATSINLRNTLYQTWRQDGDKLILKGLRINNRQKSEIEDTFKIVLLEADTLILTDSKGQTVGYGYVE